MQKAITLFLCIFLSHLWALFLSALMLLLIEDNPFDSMHTYQGTLEAIADVLYWPITLVEMDSYDPTHAMFLAIFSIAAFALLLTVVAMTVALIYQKLRPTVKRS